MRIPAFVFLLMASVALALIGCTDNANSPLAPGDRAVPASGLPDVLAKVGQDLHFVTGTAHWKSVPVEFQQLARFSYTAIQHADGSVSGEVQNICTDGAAGDKNVSMNFHAKVTGLKVAGNTAKIEFMFTSGTYMGSPLADYYGGDLSHVRCWLIAIDNGEGIHATAPDVSSGILWGDNAELQYYLGKDVEWISNLGAIEFIEYMTNEVLPMLGISPVDYFHSPDNGSVQVR